MRGRAGKMNKSARKPLRLWPGVVIVILQLLVRFGVPVFAPDALFIGVLAGPVGGLAVILWWLFLSRAPWSERVGAVGLIIVALFATKRSEEHTSERQSPCNLV